MKAKRLTPAPSFNCLDIQKAIDNICNYTFESDLARTAARIYFYRTRLNMLPNQVAAIFDKHPHDVNEIAKRVGSKKNRKIKSLEYSFMQKFPSYHLERYKKHSQKIVNRINNRTLVTQ